VTRYGLLAGGVVAAVLLLIEYATGGNAFGAAEARVWLAGMVMIEFGIALVVGTNTAATAMTKEKESNALDLLLTTPLTSKYIVWGKLRGLVSFVIPMIAVPVGSVLLFALYDLFFTKGVGVAYIEGVLELAALMVAFAAFACMLGLQVSLRSNKTVRAVMVSLGTLIVILIIATALWWQITKAFGNAGSMVAPFTPFTGLWVICDPSVLFDSEKDLAAHITSVRVLGLVGSAIAVGFVALIVASMYKSMVRNFDMTLRKQTASS
jgi:ABC-type transport system involved in multi-copper enzyme maturation permease subunit